MSVAWRPGAWYSGAWAGTVWADVESEEPERITLGDAQTFRDEPEASLLLIGIAYYRTQHVRDQ